MKNIRVATIDLFVETKEKWLKTLTKEEKERDDFSFRWKKFLA